MELMRMQIHERNKQTIRLALFQCFLYALFLVSINTKAWAGLVTSNLRLDTH
jgi:hypothetical protein